LTARIPEYDLFISPDRMGLLNEGKESVRKFSKDPGFRYELPFFSSNEIKYFIKKYLGKEFNLEFTNSRGEIGMINEDDEELLDGLSETILKETNGGHPIMVKFSFLQDGLRSLLEFCLKIVRRN
jgi:hypothetical protein